MRLVLLFLGFLTAAVSAGSDPWTPGGHAEPPLVLTYFFYWYSRDTQEHFVNADGSDALTTHPARIEGYSYRSPAWWREQLLAVREAGIDAILPVYWGVPGADAGWSKVGLRHLVAAWEGLAREGRKPPPVGMFYDTSTLAWNPQGVRFDISTEEGEAFFCRTITEFFQLLPRSLWLLRDGRPVVFLYAAAFHDGENPRLFDRAQERFAEAFGTRMYLVKEVSWPYPADAGYAWGGALNLRVHDVASLGPGYDHSAVPGRAPLVVPREDGAHYRRSWEHLLALDPGRRPSITAVETWNEFHEGTDVAPSREYGHQYVALTAHYADLFRRGARIPIRGPWQGQPGVSWHEGTDVGISILSQGDGVVEVRAVDGSRCAVTVPNPHGPIRYLYADTHESFAYDEGAAAFQIQATFRLSEPATVTLEYDSGDPAASIYDGAFKPAPPLGPFTPDAWHTVSIVLPDARFTNRANGGDFRLSAGSTELAVRSLAVTRVKLP